MGNGKYILLLTAVLLLPAIFFGGCIQSIDSQDKFSVDLDHAPVYNFSRYVNASLCEPVNKTVPCSCMICTVDKPSFTALTLNLFRLRDINVTLLSAQCSFKACNATMYNNTITKYLEDKANADCKVNGADKLCAPRFFMLGQGSNPTDYAMAQRYCNGQLKMPVIWAVPNQTSGKLDKPPALPGTLSCYLQKDQMPVIVWYSAGKFIDTPEYALMVRNMSTPSSNPKVDGPIMITTEAMLDPYLPASAPGAARQLDIAKLDKVANQITTIRAKCPKCLSVLALKVTMHPNGKPDLCALDYLLNDNSSMPRPAECQGAYAGTSAWMTRTNLYRSIDLVGVGFDANADPNLSSCTSDAAIGPALTYSRAALARYYKPSVWYATGIESGPTATQGCSFNESHVQNMYSTLVTNIPALTSSGVIGVSPYRFSDNPDGAPLPYGAEKFAFNTTLGGLDAIRNVKKSGELTINSTDNSQSLVVDRYLPDRSDAAQAVFLGGNGIVYAARMSGTGVALWEQSSQAGFARTSGFFHRAAAYTWFSSCEYYYTNRAPLWRVNKTMADVVAGAQLVSTDNRSRLKVGSVESAGANETLFRGDDNRPYSARPDGSIIKIYERPIVAQSTQQPLMFSTNGKGALCSAFETTKMYSRAQVVSGSTGSAYTLSVSQNLEDKRRVAALSCGGGGCLSTVPMPRAFCALNATVPHAFPLNACIQYGEIDAEFNARDLDSLFMRAIAVQEGGLGGNGRLDSGPTAPACALAKTAYNANCFRRGSASWPFKTAAKISASVSAYCDSTVLSSKASGINNNPSNGTIACGMGLMQCIDGVGEPGLSTTQDCGGTNYNPFDPAQSACCGSNVFKSSYEAARTDMEKMWFASTDLQQEIKFEEMEWYAAWLASYNYYGIKLRDTEGYVRDYTKASGISLVQYVNDRIYSAYACRKNGGSNDCDYGIRQILRYNEGIKTCGAGCPYRDCSAPDGDGGGTGTVIIP